jgi:hypothetical protein
MQLLERPLAKRRGARRVSRRLTRADDRVEIVQTQGALPRPDGSPGGARHQRLFGFTLQ